MSCPGPPYFELKKRGLSKSWIFLQILVIVDPEKRGGSIKRKTFITSVDGAPLGGRRFYLNSLSTLLYPVTWHILMVNFDENKFGHRLSFSS